MTSNLCLNINQASVEEEVFRIFANWISEDIKRIKNLENNFNELSRIIENKLKERYLDDSIFFVISKN